VELLPFQISLPEIIVIQGEDLLNRHHSGFRQLLLHQSQLNLLYLTDKL
jgi:hypothetical protein